MMKKSLWAGLALLLCGAIPGGHGLQAAAPASQPSRAPSPSTPGVEAAQAIATITGVAISPLLGVSAVGTWKYFKTPTEKRGKLPWYARPWFWVPGLLLVTLAFVNVTFCTASP